LVTVATWNVNSVKARLPNVVEWLKAVQPDIVLLQEIKCVDEAFPREEIGELGYNIRTHGQKSYNGVAILAKSTIDESSSGLPGDDTDQHARYIEAVVGGLRVASIYLPNGNPIGTEKFAYKLAWMERLREHFGHLLEDDDALVFGGDYNVIPEPIDVYNPSDWLGDALYQPESRASFRALEYLGLTDAYRALHPGDARAYTFWDYQGGAWPLDRGIRIDHFLLSPQATDRLTGCRIDKDPRGKPRASDHTPVIVELRDG
jgi:exodeoxyribonuclease III